MLPCMCWAVPLKYPPSLKDGCQCPEASGKWPVAQSWTFHQVDRLVVLFLAATVSRLPKAKVAGLLCKSDWFTGIGGKTAGC